MLYPELIVLCFSKIPVVNLDLMVPSSTCVDLYNKIRKTRNIQIPLPWACNSGVECSLCIFYPDKSARSLGFNSQLVQLFGAFFMISEYQG